MDNLKSELLEVENEISAKELETKNLYKWLNRMDGICFSLCYIVSAVVMLATLFNRGSFIGLRGFLGLCALALYIGVILMVLFGFLIEGWVAKFIFWKFNTTKESYDTHKNLIFQLNERKYKIQSYILVKEEQIRKVREQAFLDKLLDFIKDISNKKRNIRKEEAIIVQRSLESELYYFRDYLYQLHTRSYYTNRLDKTRKIILNWDDIPQASDSILNRSTKKIDYDTNKPIEELFVTLSEPKKERIVPISKVSIKQDYIRLNEQKYEIGSLGEKFAIEWEKKRLIRKGMEQYIDKIKHVSLTDDSLGYDIESFNENGEKIFIEVKTTKDAHKAAFYVSTNELSAMKELKNYFIFRIYNFDVLTGFGNMFVINCMDGTLHQYYDLKPTSYIVSPK